MSVLQNAHNRRTGLVEMFLLGWCLLTSDEMRGGGRGAVEMDMNPEPKTLNTSLSEATLNCPILSDPVMRPAIK